MSHLRDLQKATTNDDLCLVNFYTEIYFDVEWVILMI